MNGDKQDYEDFISSPPDTMKFLSKEQMQLMEEYTEIIRNISGRNKTVKEIHAIFWSPEKKEYSKTIKTVYRHLDALENAGLVKVVGHRKPKDSRLTEKLYSRAAKVFFLEEKDRGPRWWETKEGEEQISEIVRVVLEYFDVGEEKADIFEQLLKQYYDGWDSTVMDVFAKTQENEVISDIFGRADINQIKSIAGFIGTLGAFSKNPSLLESMYRELGL
jgi:DNA-binding transcriptional ArsR family regulator